MKLNTFSFCILQPGAYIGEEEILFKKKRKYNLVAATDVDTMVLYKEDFEKLFEKEYPHVYKKILDLSLM